MIDDAPHPELPWLPPAGDLAEPRRSRIAATVIAAAIGDAVGHPTEFVGSFEAIRAKWPPAGVTGFELWWRRDGKRYQ